ncbi:type II toxin-antitoxin system VapC family toxin [Crocosphaera sp.]|uniref:type II toxin-antitoxin system VapC family toxin n=1 Tax=Crocosphaera sp. TaxID=2729996 RepID=UPI003F28FBF1|nr:type II toxin-antitoxin system VapC family toxin [Crocosphaera sp.]
MIILDTHIWVWWNHHDSRLTNHYQDIINQQRLQGLGVCSISLIEISRLVSKKRLILPCSIQEWFKIALGQEGVQLLSITPEIAINAYTLPGNFHKDPADRLIVATARIYDVSLLTVDEKILAYPYVKTIES